ncbi:replication initiator protein A [Liquorilactobacillus hordei]|uniref:replication initiator protein A n=1 Tax=Liquorilactobacillus hordei TaxID=468911 RepID=UPI001CBC6C43|nr:replication initiator protein A [Liquorilactobacillus hordei]MBZ2406674.1 plasmid replication initiation protein [Liquorilactobacillus hordei]
MNNKDKANDNFSFYEASNVYGTLFFQFPKVLMYGEKYKKLSDTAKLAYMVLKDRLEYSLRNNWVDDEGHVYFIFTNEELKNLFNCSNDKLNKVKGELEKANLLFQKHMGFNRTTMRNEPNHLYLSKLEVQATDVYLRGNYSQNNAEPLDTSGLPKNRNPHDTARPLGTSGLPKNRNPHDTAEKDAQSVDTSGLPKTGLNLYITTADTTRYNNTDTQKNSNSKDIPNSFTQKQIEKQNQDLLANMGSFLLDPISNKHFLNQENIKLLALWSNDPQQVRNYCRIILNAKKAVIEEHKEFGEIPSLIYMDQDNLEIQKLINFVLHRCFNYVRSGKKIRKSFDSLLFTSLKTSFENYAATSLANKN